MAPGGPAARRPWWRTGTQVRLPRASTAAILAAAGAALFAGAGILVHTGATVWDERAYRTINEVPSEMASLLTPLARLCSPVGIAVTAVVAAVYVAVRGRSIFPVLVSASAGGVAWLAASLAKAVADRPRPYEVMAGAVLRQSPAHGTSFPSTHTAVAVATVIALVPFLPRPAEIAAVAYAVLVGWSRVYLGVHYPLDVIGGAGIGLLVGGLVLLPVGRLFRRPQPA